MALNAYFAATGTKQGVFKGSNTQKARDSIELIAANYQVITPYDVASGQTSGKRQHKPIVITKELDASSPQFQTALTTNETLSSAKITFYASVLGTDRSTGVGSEQVSYTIELVNAIVVSYDLRMLNNRHPDLMKFKEYEEIALIFQKITCTWLKGGVTYMDDWITPQ
jgi:type VI secretion system secreted protein Hcp